MKKARVYLGLSTISSSINHWVFLSVFLFSFNSLNAQRLDFELKAGIVKLGDFFIEKHQFDDTTYFLLNTKVRLFYLISTHEVDYSSFTVYVNDTLIKSEVLAIANGEEDSYSRTVKNGGTYQVFKRNEDGKENFSIEHLGLINSSSRMFFNKPEGINYSYAELYGNLGTVKVMDDDYYRITNQKTGRKTDYYYSGDSPIKRKIEYPIVNFVMHRLDSNAVTSTRDELEVRYQAIFAQ
ncbi:MAG: DUF6134 family protein [Salibacteraceae bacterium]